MKKLLAIAIVFMFFMIAFIRLYGCSSVPIINLTEITKTISCPFADDINCQKCHTWKKEIIDWHNPETDKVGKVEIILPEGVDIDFNTGQTIIINPNSSSKDWICENVFHDSYSISVLYNKWNLSYLPPTPPIALINIISSNGTKVFKYWIYKNGVQVEVDKKEADLYIVGLRSGVKI